MSYSITACQMRKKRVWLTLYPLCQNSISQSSEEERKWRARTCIIPRNVIPAFIKLKLICTVICHQNYKSIFPLTCLPPKCRTTATATLYLSHGVRRGFFPMGCFFSCICVWGLLVDVRNMLSEGSAKQEIEHFIKHFF